MTDSIGPAFIQQCERQLFELSLSRLKKCLALSSEEEIWFRPNTATVAIGNLVLHLCGNVQQWIVSGLGGAPDVRERAKEFSEQGPLPTAELLERLEKTMAEAKAVLQSLDPARLLDKRTVQGFEETGVSLLLHAVEHFSYHVGQIIYIVKSKHAVDTKYYEGQDLDITSSSMRPGEKHS